MYEIEILLIDDNAADIERTQETFNQNKLKNNLNIVSNGMDAQAFLRREIAVPYPDLILLDSKFLGSADQNLLETIQQDTELRDVPLLILTGGDGKDIVLPSDHLGRPYGIVPKPLNFLQFIDVVKTIKSFKVSIVTSH